MTPLEDLPRGYYRVSLASPVDASMLDVTPPCPTCKSRDCQWASAYGEERDDGDLVHLEYFCIDCLSEDSSAPPKSGKFRILRLVTK